MTMKILVSDDVRDVYKRQIQYNSRACMARYAAIARYVGLPGATDKQLTDSLVKAICAMNKELNLSLIHISLTRPAKRRTPKSCSGDWHMPISA